MYNTLLHADITAQLRQKRWQQSATEFQKLQQKVKFDLGI